MYVLRQLYKVIFMYNYQTPNDLPLNRIGFEINITAYTANIILVQLLTAVLLCSKGEGKSYSLGV